MTMDELGCSGAWFVWVLGCLGGRDIVSLGRRQQFVRGTRPPRRNTVHHPSTHPSIRPAFHQHTPGIMMPLACAAPASTVRITKYPGAGECGKSTFFKQIGLLYGKPWTQAERINFRRIIHANTIQAMKILIEDGVYGLDLAHDARLKQSMVSWGGWVVAKSTPPGASAVRCAWSVAARRGPA